LSCARRNETLILNKRAAKLGSPEGAYTLAVLYRQQGIKRWANYWFNSAADMGDADARLELSRQLNFYLVEFTCGAHS
jgi:TPR repeat protein